MRRLTKDVPQWYDVTITEALQLTIRVEAHSPMEAEQIVSDDWGKQEFILGAEHFAGVEFKVEPVDKSREQS